jgi:hypothetical protein
VSAVGVVVAGAGRWSVGIYVGKLAEDVKKLTFGSCGDSLVSRRIAGLFLDGVYVDNPHGSVRFLLGQGVYQRRTDLTAALQNS